MKSKMKGMVGGGGGSENVRTKPIFGENKVWWGGGEVKKVSKNGLKHILVLEFLKSNKTWKIVVTVHGRTTNQSNGQTHGHYSAQLSRSALETARLKNVNLTSHTPRSTHSRIGTVEPEQPQINSTLNVKVSGHKNQQITGYFADPTA